MVTRETRYHVSIAELLERNFMSHVAGLFRTPRNMLKILCLSGDHQFFQKPLGINFLYNRGLTFLFIGRGGIIWTRELLSAKLSTVEVTGAHFPGALSRVYVVLMLWQIHKVITFKNLLQRLFNAVPRSFQVMSLDSLESCILRAIDA